MPEPTREEALAALLKQTSMSHVPVWLADLLRELVARESAFPPIVEEQDSKPEYIYPH